MCLVLLGLGAVLTLWLFWDEVLIFRDELGVWILDLINWLFWRE